MEDEGDEDEGEGNSSARARGYSAQHGSNNSRSGGPGGAGGGVRRSLDSERSAGRRRRQQAVIAAPHNDEDRVRAGQGTTAPAGLGCLRFGLLSASSTALLSAGWWAVTLHGRVLSRAQGITDGTVLMIGAQDPGPACQRLCPLQHAGDSICTATGPGIWYGNQ